MATTQDSKDRNYSDAERLEQAIGSRLTDFKSSKSIIVTTPRSPALPAWITELEQAAINPISTAPNSPSRRFAGLTVNRRGRRDNLR